MASDVNPSILEALKYTCTVFSALGIQNLTSQDFLLAAVNDPSASPSMWISLHRLVCMKAEEAPELVQDLNVSVKATGPSTDGLIHVVKFYLSLWGFPGTSAIFELSYDTECSQILLISLAWMMSRCGLFKKALKTQVKKGSMCLARMTDLTASSIAMDRVRVKREETEGYVSKLLAALDNISDVRLRAKARSQQALLLHGKVRMSIMNLHSLQSARARKIHKFNELQSGLKIPDLEGYPLSHFDVYVLRNEKAVEKDIGTLNSIKHMNEEVTLFKNHERTFWEWMKKVALGHTLQVSTSERGKSSNLLNQFCVAPVVQISDPRLNSDKDPRSNIVIRTSLTNSDGAMFISSIANVFCRRERTKYIQSESGLTSSDDGADMVLQRLCSVATLVAKILARFRTRNRERVYELLHDYLQTDCYILRNL